MIDLHAEPSLPLSGFALYQNGRLLLQGGTPASCCFCQPDKLSPEAYKQLIWLLEDALGAQRNDLAQTDPASIRSLLTAIALCHANRPCDRFTGAILSRGIEPSPIAFTPKHADPKPSGGGLRQPMAGLLPRPSLPARTHPADLEHLGPVSEAGRPQVA
jgi:hypothetical protein